MKGDGTFGDAVVFVVDDDQAMRESIEYLLGSVGLAARTFATAQDFLDRFDPEVPSCLLTDVRMPGISGLALQEELNTRGHAIPVVIMTAHADVPMAVRAMQQGALDFIEKPFNDQALLELLYRALGRDAERRREEGAGREVRRRLELLTPREHEVLDLIVAGQLNKQIAAHLGLSVKTVELHRSRVMEKMEAGNLADLVRQVMLVRAA